MPRINIEVENFLSVTEASRRGVSRLVADAEKGAELVIGRNSVPVAAVVSVERLAEIQEMQEDLRDLLVAAARVLADDGRRTSFDAVLEMFGLTDENLDTAED